MVKPVFVKNRFVTIPLSGKIRDGSCKQPGTCEIMLSAYKGINREYFAAPALHIFLEEDDVCTLDTGRLTLEDHQNIVDEAKKHWARTVLKGKVRHHISVLNEVLETQPLYGAYRTHSAGHPRDFMNDLALLQMKPRTVEKIKTIPQLHNHCSINNVVELTRDGINNGLLDLDKPANQRRNAPIMLARGRRLVLTRMRDSPSFSQVGYQLAFFIQQGYVS